MKKISLIMLVILIGSLIPVIILSPVEADIGWNVPDQLTTNTSHDGVPSISGDGSKVAFSSYVDGDYEIFVVNSDGTGLTQVTTNTAYDEFPCISNDGTKIAFMSDLDGDLEIFVVNSDGTGLTQVTTNVANEFMPSIGGDGSKVAFSSDIDGDFEIFVVNFDGSGLTQLTTNNATDAYPSISGDGSKVAFSSDIDGDFEIFVVNFDGSGLTQLTTNNATDWMPSISGGGHKIAFQSDVDGDYEIFVVNSDGSGFVQLTSNTATDEEPSISDDGTKIAFRSDVDGDYEIFVVRARVIETVYIKADGSVVPSETPIQRYGNLYIFTSNISAQVLVEKSDIIIDGEGYTLQGSGAGDNGFYLFGLSNVTIQNTNIQGFGACSINLLSTNDCTLSGNNITNNIYGIQIYASSNNLLEHNIITDNSYNLDISGSELSHFVHDIDMSNTVNGNPVYYWISKHDLVVPSNAGYVGLVDCNNITVQNQNLTNNGQGILMEYTTDSKILQNNITNNMHGLYILGSSSNTISGNEIAHNAYGIYVIDSDGNPIFHNSFIDNTDQCYSSNSLNVWDNGYLGGNYWSDYSGVDVDHDGIGDTSYVIDENNVDNYPLMNPGVPNFNNYLVVQGSNNRIYYRNYFNGAWKDWKVVPSGTTCDTPAAAVANDKLYMVVRGMDGNSLYFGSINLVDDSFSGWDWISGSTPSKPVLIKEDDSNLCLVVRGTDNRIYYRFYYCLADYWNGWLVTPSGTTPDTPAAAINGDYLHLVVRGMTGGIYHQQVYIPTQDYSGWNSGSGDTPSAPTLTNYGDDVILVVRGNNNIIYYKIWNEEWPAHFNPILEATTHLQAYGPSAIVIGNQLHIVVLSSGDYMKHGYLNLDTDVWEPWDALSGSTPSGPTLTN
jgi:parallel beta-helix repeat protein